MQGCVFKAQTGFQRLSIQTIPVYLVILFGMLFFQANLAEAKNSCACERVSCGPCQKKVVVGKIVSFCDWGNIKVCKKVVCENVNYYFTCISGVQKPKKKEKILKPKPADELELVYEGDNADDLFIEPEPERKPASVKPKKKKKKVTRVEALGRKLASNESRRFGEKSWVEQKSGRVGKGSSLLQLQRFGQALTLKKGQELFVGDTIVNGAKKDATLVLLYDSDRIELTLKPKTKLMVEDPFSILGRFQPLLYLVYGALEYQVELKEGSFDLLAGQILVRSHSGRHRVGYEMADESLNVKVESLEQNVDIIKASNLMGEKLVVKEGTFLTWVSETRKELFSMDEKMALVDQGFITPVFQIPNFKPPKKASDEPPKVGLQLADWSKKPPKNSKVRGLALTDMDALCTKPEARFQQCAWACEGNPKGSGSCRAEKPGVHCVRRVCNAAGQWGGATAFATSYKDLCPPDGIRIGECSP